MAGVERLSGDRLDRLPAHVRRPGWLRGATRVRAAHIGAGAFHRCHQADYVEDLLEAGHDTALVAINLRPPSLGPLLGPQDGFYTRTLRDGDAAETRVIGAIRAVADAAANPGGALDWLTTPEVTTVTLTVTEKGYCHVPATGVLDLDHPDIRADLERRGEVPRSLPGFLVAALRLRRDERAGPINLVSCDNVASNGRILRRVLLSMAEAMAPDLLGWLEENVATPSTMVDRIVPATSAADIDGLQARLGVRDEAAVSGEPFRQWVLEDDLRAPRPAWEMAGAEIVADVAGHEFTKMRVLNGAQTMLSLLGPLRGHAFSHEAVRDPVLLGFVHRTLAEETLPHLPPAEGMEPRAYLETSLRRIGNRAIHHRCHQIATDTSQKIRQRLFDPIRARRAAGRPATGLEAGVAAWLAYLSEMLPQSHGRWTPEDPVTRRLVGARDFDALARTLLSIEEVFGADLARDEGFRDRVTATARRLVGGEIEGALGGTT